MAGVVVERYMYSPYGVVNIRNGNWSLNSNPGGSYQWVYLHQGGRLNADAGLYHFRHRDFSPTLGRWMNQDPLGYVDGGNLYEYVRGGPTGAVDPMGLNRYITHWASEISALHAGVAVDTWMCDNGEWVKTGVVTFDFSVDWNSQFYFLGIALWKGMWTKSQGLNVINPITISSNPCEDRVMLKILEKQKVDPPYYGALVANCMYWSVAALQWGMGTACGTTCCNEFGDGGAGGSW